MKTRAHIKQLRQVALLASIVWFFYWGHSAYLSIKAHDRAEAAELKADSRRAWASAGRHVQAKKAATQSLIRSISWGFFIPLALLVAGEADANIRRLRSRSK